MLRGGFLPKGDAACYTSLGGILVGLRPDGLLWRELLLVCGFLLELHLVRRQVVFFRPDDLRLAQGVRLEGGVVGGVEEVLVGGLGRVIILLFERGGVLVNPRWGRGKGTSGTCGGTRSRQ